MFGFSLAKIGAVLVFVLTVFGAGYGLAWKQCQVQIGTLQGAIKVANAEAAKVLAEEREKAQRAEAQQRASAEKLQEQYNEIKKHNDGLSAELADAWVQYRAANQPNSSCPTNQASDPTGSAGDNEAGEYLDPDRLSEELNKFVQKASPTIDRRDEDLHFIIQWLNSLPPEMLDPAD